MHPEAVFSGLFIHRVIHIKIEANRGAKWYYIVSYYDVVIREQMTTNRYMAMYIFNDYINVYDVCVVIVYAVFYDDLRSHWGKWVCITGYKNSSKVLLLFYIYLFILKDKYI